MEGVRRRAHSWLSRSPITRARSSDPSFSRLRLHPEPMPAEITTVLSGSTAWVTHSRYYRALQQLGTITLIRSLLVETGAVACGWSTDEVYCAVDRLELKVDAVSRVTIFACSERIKVVLISVSFRYRLCRYRALCLDLILVPARVRNHNRAFPAGCDFSQIRFLLFLSITQSLLVSLVERL